MTELVIGSGYTWKKLQLPIKFNGKKVKPSDLVLRLDVSIRDNKTITRKIIENQNQATAGQKMTSIKFSGNYKLGKSLTVRLYYDRVMNTPIYFYIISDSKYKCWCSSSIYASIETLRSLL